MVYISYHRLVIDLLQITRLIRTMVADFDLEKQESKRYSEFKLSNS